MIFLFRYWQLAAGASAAFFVSYLLHSFDVSRIESNWKGKLEDQKIFLLQQCEEDKKITEETNAYYEKQIGDIAAKLNKYRMHAGKCVSVANTTELSNGGGRPTKPDGLTVDWLRSFAAQCREYQAQRITYDMYFEKLRTH